MVAAAREGTEMYVERLVVDGLLVWRRNDDGGLEFWHELTPRQVALAQAIMKCHPLLNWEETVCAMLEAPP